MPEPLTLIGRFSSRTSPTERMYLNAPTVCRGRIRSPEPGITPTTGTTTTKRTCQAPRSRRGIQAHPDFGFNETVAASSLPRPTEFILLADAGRSDNTPSRGGMYPQPWAFDVSSQSRILKRHAKGTANIAFADGHVLSQNADRTWRSFED